jgi:ParB/RepB/Spo0J family partition protein
MTDFKNVPLSEIRPDPNQPRKFFDQGALDELTKSVSKDGVLEPIMIRPNGKGYIIVYGERRFKAAVAAELKEIPAQIRELSQEEAFEFQITENLHRKDVHPMEEANSYDRLQKKDPTKNTVKELATRFAKSEGYVMQRLSFNNLIPEFQKDFYEGKFITGHAVILSRLTKDNQQIVKKDCRNGYGTPAELSDWIDRAIVHSLAEAKFKQDDPELLPSAGPCTTCMKRSGCNQLLFPDIKAKDRCFDKQCFDKKTSLAFSIKLKEIIETKPDIILVQSPHRDSNKEAVALAKQMKIRVLEDGEDFQEYSYGSFKKKAQGFWLNSWYQGEIKTIYLKGVTTVDKNGKKIASPEKPAEEQISDIQSREKRAKELDDSKVWDELKKHFRPEVNLPHIKGEFSQNEREAIAQSLFKKLDYSLSDAFEKYFKIKNGDFSKVDAATLNQMIRYFFLCILPPNALYGAFDEEALVCIKIAKDYFPTVIKDIQDKQSDIASKRAERVAKRIADLKKTIKTKAKPPIAKIKK